MSFSITPRSKGHVWLPLSESVIISTQAFPGFHQDISLFWHGMRLADRQISSHWRQRRFTRRSRGQAQHLVHNPLCPVRKTRLSCYRLFNASLVWRRGEAVAFNLSFQCTDRVIRHGQLQTPCERIPTLCHGLKRRLVWHGRRQLLGPGQNGHRPEKYTACGCHQHDCQQTARGGLRGRLRHQN